MSLHLFLNILTGTVPALNLRAILNFLNCVCRDMGNTSSSSSSQPLKEVPAVSNVTSEKSDNSTNNVNNNTSNDNVPPPPIICSTSTVDTTNAIPSPLLEASSNTVTSPGKRLLDLNELIASKEIEMHLLLDQLAEARNKEKEAIEYSTAQINDFNGEIDLFYETAKNDLTAACDNALKEVIQSKDNELAETITMLQTVVFPERLLFAREDIMSRYVVNELTDEWNSRYNQLVELQQRDIETVKRIAQQEYDKTRASLKSAFTKEIAELEEKDRIEKKKRGSGMFSWLSPTKKSKPESDDEDEDEEDNVEN